MITQLTASARFLFQKLSHAGNIAREVSVSKITNLMGSNMYRFKQGKTFFKNLFNFQKNTAASPFLPQTDMNQAWEDAKVQYENTLKVARLAFKDNKQAGSLLQLSEKTYTRGITCWLQHAQIFYATLLTNPKLQHEMARFGYSEKKLRFELENIEERALALMHISKAPGEACTKQVKRRRRRTAR